MAKVAVLLNEHNNNLEQYYAELYIGIHGEFDIWMMLMFSLLNGQNVSAVDLILSKSDERIILSRVKKLEIRNRYMKKSTLLLLFGQLCILVVVGLICYVVLFTTESIWGEDPINKGNSRYNCFNSTMLYFQIMAAECAEISVDIVCSIVKI